MGSEEIPGPGDGLLDEPELPPRSDVRARSASAAVAPDPSAGDVVGPYRLMDVLGRGGAGTVFKAEHTQNGRIVALKVLAAEKAKRARVVRRFFDEVRAASSVDHPGLVRAYDFIEQDQPRRLAYAMEFVDGESLRQRLRRERALDLREAIAIGVQVCDALTALHDAGIIHRDLKPENIILVDREDRTKVKLLDFGVVKFLPVDRSAPIETGGAGTFVGTPRYMAPEQAAGAHVDHRADLFALGVMMFEMITSNCPHEGESLRDVVLAKLKGAPRITVNPEREILPQELTDVVDACLKLQPALRPESAQSVQTALVDAELILFAVGRPVRVGGQPSAPTEPGPSWTSATVDAADPESPDVELATVDGTRHLLAEPENRPDTTDAATAELGARWALAIFLIATLAVCLALAARLLVPERSILVLPEQAPAGRSVP